MPTSRGERLSPAAGYRLWAPTYAQETVVSALEDRTVAAMLPVLDGRRLLDVGCGIGRRIAAAGRRPRVAVGLDLVPEMLLRAEGEWMRVAGDVRSLPFAEASFDVVWCRLVLGHVQDLAACYAEMSRVSSETATLIVSDFHPAAVAAGHTRSFRDEAGRLHEVEHHVHDVTHHVDNAERFGWRLAARADAPPGEPERPFYERAGRLSQLDAQRNLPVVLVMCFER